MPNKGKSDLKTMILSGTILLLLLLPLLGPPLHGTLTLCLRKDAIHRVATTDIQQLFQSSPEEKCTPVHIVLAYAEMALIIIGLLAIIAVVKDKPKLRTFTAVFFWTIPVLIVTAEVYELIQFHNASTVLHCLWFLAIWIYSYCLYYVVSVNINVEKEQMDSSESDSDFELVEL